MAYLMTSCFISQILFVLQHRWVRGRTWQMGSPYELEEEAGLEQTVISDGKEMKIWVKGGTHFRGKGSGKTFFEEIIFKRGLEE